MFFFLCVCVQSKCDHKLNYRKQKSTDAGITATTMASVMVGCAVVGIAAVWLLVRPRTVALLTP